MNCDECMAECGICNGIIADLRARLAAAEAEAARLRAELAAAKVFPNGWPQPLFLHVEEDGAVCIEWIADDENGRERRVLFAWDPTEGASAVRTAQEGQTFDDGATAGRFLARCLDEARAALAPRGGGT